MIVDLHHYKTATAMMTVSHYHQDYSDQDIKEFVEPPLALGNYLIIEDETGFPYVFATWAFPEMHHIDTYVRTGKFPPSGFRGCGDSPWIIDFIAFGGFQSTRAGFRYLKDTFIEMGYIDCYWLRTETGKIGFHKLKEN
tara:strand:- start:2215 stop:2631 length:417 start_codon:yes stop_codon:yes gene_type:complete